MKLRLLRRGAAVVEDDRVAAPRAARWHPEARLACRNVTVAEQTLAALMPPVGMPKPSV
jgi:hypothetical protein